MNYSRLNHGLLLFILTMAMSFAFGVQNIRAASISQKPFKKPRIIKSLGQLRNDELLLVGKIELVPALEDIEQNLLRRKHRNKAYMIFRDESKFNPQGRFTKKGRVLVKIGDPYFISMPRHQNQYFGASIIMRIDKTDGVVDAILPGNHHLSPEENDLAVYVGTLRYYRDEFFGITRIEVVDEYDQALPKFRNQFGNAKLIKRIWRLNSEEVQHEQPRESEKDLNESKSI